jgi:hypothetical protein
MLEIEQTNRQLFEYTDWTWDHMRVGKGKLQNELVISLKYQPLARCGHAVHLKDLHGLLFATICCLCSPPPFLEGGRIPFGVLAADG